MGFYYENYGISEVPPQPQLAHTESSVLWACGRTPLTTHDLGHGVSTNVEDLRNSACGGALSVKKCGVDPQPTQSSPSFQKWDDRDDNSGIRTQIAV